ncbi:MAG: c-type cytochrome [Gemmatimonadaceae bacterium]
MRRQHLLSSSGFGAMLCATLAVVACKDADDKPSQIVAQGHADRGPAAINRYGCGSCHNIPGVHGANGLAAPPLTSFSKRAFIAGEVTNNPENLITWITVPQSIEPGTAMPNLGVLDEDARDIAAYLYTLK